MCVLGGAVVVTLLLIAGDYAHRRTSWDVFANDGRWDADSERSYIEIVGYLQLLAAAALVLLLGRRSAPGNSVITAWGVVLLLVLADDVFALHEWIGATLADAGAPALPGLRREDTGELLTWAALGTGCSALLLATHRRSGPQGRQVSWTLLGLILVLSVFVVGVDMLHIVVSPVAPSVVEGALIYLEASGELLTMTGLLVAAMHLLSQEQQRDGDAPRL